MARYRFRCTECGAEDDRTIAITDYDAAAPKQQCSCGAPMIRVYEAPLHVSASGRWRERVASVGPADFMREETS